MARAEARANRRRAAVNQPRARWPVLPVTLQLPARHHSWGKSRRPQTDRHVALAVPIGRERSVILPVEEQPKQLHMVALAESEGRADGQGSRDQPENRQAIARGGNSRARPGLPPLACDVAGIYIAGSTSFAG
jgi:hypothetical protein